MTMTTTADMPEALDVFEQQTRVEKEKLARVQERQRLVDGIATVMGTKQGRDVIRWVLKLTGLYQSLSVGDSLQMAVLSGRRDVGLEVLRMLNSAVPELVLLMNKEENNG
nr:MAG TPA: hypothetical protein [Caudoviricetes sp.]